MNHGSPLTNQLVNQLIASAIASGNQRPLKALAARFRSWNPAQLAAVGWLSGW